MEYDVGCLDLEEPPNLKTLKSIGTSVREI